MQNFLHYKNCQIKILKNKVINGLQKNVMDNTFLLCQAQGINKEIAEAAEYCNKHQVNTLCSQCNQQGLEK